MTTLPVIALALTVTVSMKKTPTSKGPAAVAEFSFEARRAFLTGLFQRKQQRRREAQERALEKRKAERRLLRAERREEIRQHIQHVQKSRRAAAAAAAAINVKKQPSSSSSSKENGNGNAGRKAASAEPPTLLTAKAQSDVFSKQSTSQVLEAVRLVAASAEGADVAPWQVGSCVSISVGHFAAPPHTTNSQRQPLQRPAAAAPQAAPIAPKGSKQEGQKSGSASGSSQAAKKGKKGTLRRRRGGCKGRKPQRKRHMSRKLQGRRGKRK